MKNIAYYSGIFASAALLFASCQQEEVDVWNSATHEYDGRYVVGSACTEFPAKSSAILNGNEIYLYNTAANIATELWVEDVSSKFPLKGKLSLSGGVTGFSAPETENANSTVYIYNGSKYVLFISANADEFPVATAAGQKVDGKQEYARLVVEEGKILSKAATTIGGNKADSIFLKFTLRSNSIELESYQTNSALWADPGTPEYAWQRKESTAPTYNSAWDEHWIVSGYRYTGYPEDMVH
jgi:hypothetical protein